MSAEETLFTTITQRAADDPTFYDVSDRLAVVNAVLDETSESIATGDTTVTPYNSQALTVLLVETSNALGRLAETIQTARNDLAGRN